MAAFYLHVASLVVLFRVAPLNGQTVVENSHAAAVQERGVETQVGNVAIESPTPIVWARLSKDYLESHVARDVDSKKPVRDLVLGTTIRGKSRTVGKTRLVLQPSDERAVGRIEFVGTVRAHVTGVNGPATFRYVSDSRFRAHKPLVIKDGRLTALPAVATVNTELTPTSLQTSLPGLRGQIVRRIASRREANSRAAANVITANHTAYDIRDDLNRKVNASMAAIQTKVEQQLAKVAPGGSAGPLHVLSSSTSDHIELAVYDAAENVERCVLPTFDVPDNCQAVVRLHHKAFARAMFDSEAREKLWARLVPVETNLVTSVEARPKSSTSAFDFANWATDGEWLVYEAKVPGSLAVSDRVVVGSGADPQPIK